MLADSLIPARSPFGPLILVAFILLFFGIFRFRGRLSGTPRPEEQLRHALLWTIGPWISIIVLSIILVGTVVSLFTPSR